MYAEPSGDDGLVMRRLMLLAESDVRDVADKPGATNAFEIISTDKSFSVFCASSTEKQQ